MHSKTQRHHLPNQTAAAAAAAVLVTSVLAAATGTGVAAQFGIRQCQLAEPEYVQECLTVVLPATVNVTVPVTVSVSVTMTLAVTVAVLVAEASTTVSLGEAQVKPAEQELHGVLPVKLLVTAPVAEWRLPMLAGMKLGTSWGYSRKEALAGLGGSGGFVTVVKGFAHAGKW